MVPEGISFICHVVTEPYGRRGSVEVTIVDTKVFDCLDDVVGYLWLLTGYLYVGLGGLRELLVAYSRRRAGTLRPEGLPRCQVEVAPRLVPHIGECLQTGSVCDAIEGRLLLPIGRAWLNG